MKDSNDRWLTRALFFETASIDSRAKFNCPYTLKEDNHEVDGILYQSLRKIYLQYGDPTEYVFATEVLLSWDRWQHLCKASFFAPHIKAWREELAVKLQAEGIKLMVEEASSGSRSSAGAAKWLAERGWDKSDKRGRPSKKSVAEEAARMDKVKDETEQLLEHARSLN